MATSTTATQAMPLNGSRVAGSAEDIGGQRPQVQGPALHGPGAPAPAASHLTELPSVPVDELLDDHAAELAEIRRWASSDAGQIARMQNPLGFANVRAHAAAHQAALGRQGARAAAAQTVAQAPSRKR